MNNYYRENCHFLKEGKKNKYCSCLRSFYNGGRDCEGCNFHKTDEEFKKGWGSRR